MNPELLESYNRIQSSIKDINTRIDADLARIAEIRAGLESNIPLRIKNLEDHLEKIDDYVLKIKSLQEIAKRNMDSQNVLTIEAPEGYRVNLNRLKNWALLIDPTSDNDPYAQKLYAVAKCDECFLEKKRSEFTSRIEELKADQASGLTGEMVNLEKEIDDLRAERKRISEGHDVAELAEQLFKEHSAFEFLEPPAEYAPVTDIPEKIAFGSYGVSLGFGEEAKETLGRRLGRYYDPNAATMLVPAEVPFDEELVLNISCIPSRSKFLDQALQNLVLNQIHKSPAGSRKIHVIDGIRYNSNAMGSLRQLEGTFAMEQIPRNPEQLTASLEQIVSSFSDMDDLLELNDSVKEYNSDPDVKRKLPYSTVLVYGWPHAYGERERELIRRIMIGYERYGISCIIVTYDNGMRRNESIGDLTEYAMQNAINIKMTSKETIWEHEGEERSFQWYTIGDDLPASYAESLRSVDLGIETIGNEYIKRYSLTDRPPYTRAYKKLELPVGIDGKDEAHSISFENENFATYLVGASRSGKSTLLHTIIAGLLRNYHPDNVELWLADFKQLEFKRYMKHLPPHVKYVLLDESQELVYDLIDKLTDEMMYRQRLFSRLGKQRIDQIDPRELDKPLPVIFVILDEFSIMSQSVSDSPIYKTRLQNLLAKGAALGMKFLFSSQTFTTGVAGLTSTARAQIQQRISMKGTTDEISATLELSANLKTQQVRNWMEALPPHYALIKYRQGADKLPEVKRLLVMYFKDYAPRDQMIDDINSRMHPTDKYDPADITSYVDKSPVLVDGNSYEQFDKNVLLQYMKDYGASPQDQYLALGSPRLMTPMRPLILSPETRENILLIARSAEAACGASVLMSSMKSFAAQGGEVVIWAYPRHPLYASYRDVFAREGYRIAEGIDEVCDEIRSVKASILAKNAERKLIVMLGMDRICMDFEFVDDSTSGSRSGRSNTASAQRIAQFNKAAVSDENAYKQEYAQKWVAHKRAFKREAKKKAADENELNEMIRQEELRFHEEYFKNRPDLQTMEQTVSVNAAAAASMGAPAGVSGGPAAGAGSSAGVSGGPAADTGAPSASAGAASAHMPASPVRSGTDSGENKNSGAYDAADDFVYIMKQGSRNGIHFLMCLNSAADLKQTGVKADFFRHKLLFQISADDSRNLIGNKGASLTPEHICLYDDTLARFSFRPYIHPDIGWEGWYVDDNGELISPFAETED